MNYLNGIVSFNILHHKPDLFTIPAEHISLNQLVNDYKICIFIGQQPFFSLDRE